MRCIARRLRTKVRDRHVRLALLSLVLADYADRRHAHGTARGSDQDQEK
jgi:hypothetical protein